MKEHITGAERRIRTAGPFFVFLSAVCFSLGGLLMKYIPWNGMAINGARNVIAFAVLWCYLLCTGHRIRMNRAVLTGAVSMSGSNILYSLANKMTTAGNTIILQYTAPIWVMVFSALFFRRRPSRRDLTAAFFVFAGVLCFFIDSLSAGNMTGNLLALLSGVSYAGIFMMNSSEDSDSLSSVLFGMLLNLLTGLPFLLREDLAAAAPLTWVCVLLLGLVQLGLAYIFLSRGLQDTPAITASLISGIEPVLNPVLVALFYGELLTPLSLLGAVIVFISVIVYNVVSMI